MVGEASHPVLCSVFLFCVLPAGMGKQVKDAGKTLSSSAGGADDLTTVLTHTVILRGSRVALLGRITGLGHGIQWVALDTKGLN